MKKIVFLFIFGAIFCSAESLYFMPYDAKNAVNALISEIKNAKSEVKIAIYSFTNKEIAKAIRDSAKRGVSFKIIFDKKQGKDNRSQIGYLGKFKNVEVCTLQGKNNGRYSGIMHNKIALIDKKSIIFGSANWSKSAFEVNYEMMIISKNMDFIAKGEEYLDRLLGECKKF
ncbi:phospholipase D-like domain-containing protein [Helicobacter sp. 23-1044]